MFKKCQEKKPLKVIPSLGSKDSRGNIFEPLTILS